MSKFLTLMVFAFSVSFLAGCADETHYPVSGEECTAEDPVQTIDANMADCAPAA